MSFQALEAVAEEPVISVTGLCRDYVVASEVVRALRGLDFEIEPNEYVAIMGPAGSGKSTLMNLLAYRLHGSLVSGMSGGIVGIGAGTGAAIVLRKVFAWNTSVGPSSIAIALLFAAAVGVVFGVRPARRAASLDPIKALRYG